MLRSGSNREGKCSLRKAYSIWPHSAMMLFIWNNIAKQISGTDFTLDTTHMNILCTL